MLGIALWIWILIFCAIGCALVNPILYFVYWEIYDRKEWKEKNDDQPRVKDVWDEFMEEYGASWWIPGVNYFIFAFLVLLLIFRPTKAFWQKFVKWFGNIKV